VAFLVFRGAAIDAATPPSPAAPAQRIADAQAVLNQYCVTCHNDRAKTAGLTLQSLDLASIGTNADRLEKVVRKLRAASMPPGGAPRPDRATYKTMTALLEAALDAAATGRPNAGRTEALHRLNRAEYQNSVRDLLNLEGVDVSLMLPSDDASYGFDNIAGVLGISPTHLERYLAAAHRISRIAVGDVTMPAYGETQVLASDLSQDYGFEMLPLGTRGGALIRRYFPVDAEYTIKFQSVAGVGTAEKEPNFLEVTVDGERVFYEKVVQNVAKALDDQSSTDYEIRVPIKGGLREVAVTYVQATTAQLEDYLQPYQRPPGVSSFKLARMGGYAGPYVSVIGVTGPLNPSSSGDTPSRRRIFVCHPATAADEMPCARRILSTLARRAYRRPAADADVNLLLDFYREARTHGDFDAGIAVALERLLTSPDFLFRIERDPGGAQAGVAYQIGDLDLASRLSFFLWSSLPDDTLIDLAARGRLHEPAVLDTQVRRMLADPKSTAFVSNFAGQWLRLRNIKNQSPDSRMFPNFDDNLRLAFRRETELFVSSIVQEDRSALDLIGANYSFLNERLARHYGIPNVYGSNFRRVAFADERRGGLLGQGSILLVTSQANRTSPVTRGKWILENLLGAPPPAPPPNVPPLEATQVKGTLRQQMEAHRANPVCASCHKLMDPLGFALENYDPVGAWRTADGTNPVDAEGSMPDGTTFQGVVGLKRALLADPSVFVNALTEKLLIYALGRGLEYYDAPAVRRIVRDAANHQYRFSSIILGIVDSVPFRMRMADPAREHMTTAAAR
jgi:mono/diheme cytochrome c family protein